VLRLPAFRYHRPTSLAEARNLLAEHGDTAMVIAGGTDLVPNLKHRLFEPDHLISINGLPELKDVRERSGQLWIGAGVSLSQVSGSPLVRERVPALADAAGHVAGPQLRNRGTIGGNLCLDTRCTYYNQTEFWRQALGYCLKKDGTVCHVTRVGKKCVAAHSADTPPVLIVMGAVAHLVGPEGERTVAVEDWFVADGIWNSVRRPSEILTGISIPLKPTRRSAYQKLRQRGSIDFPLLTVAVSGSFDEAGSVQELSGVVTALGAKPRLLTGWQDLAAGRSIDEELIEALAQRAYKQCTPLENIIVDPAWRKAMVPVQVKRALHKLKAGL